jgi:tetratricopeptide (TPR) repeat protein
VTFERGVSVRAAVIIAAGVIVYSNSLAAPFIFDDQRAILNNLQIRQLSPLSVPLSPPAETPLAGRPLVNLSFALNYAAGELDPRGYRLTNIAIHLLAALTLFGLVRRTLLLPSVTARFGAQATNLAWIVALIWALHPLQTEAIDYVTQRTESMMGLFYLLTMYCSVRALDSQPARWHATAILACMAGMACKESMVTAPVMVGLYDYMFVASPALRKIRRARLYIGLALTWLVLAALISSAGRSTVGLDTSVSPWTYLLNQAPILLMYLRLTFWPRNQVLDYGVPQTLALTDVLLPILVVAALVSVVIVLLVRRQHAGFPGAWCFITLAPTSSIIPIATEVGADRRMYLALAGLIVLVVLGTYRALTSYAPGRQRIIGGALTATICLALAAATMQRNSEYHTKLSIMKTTVERRPHARAYQMLATAYFDLGQRQEAMNYLQLSRADPLSSFMLGIEFVTEGQIPKGIEELERFVQLAPRHVAAIDAYETLGRVYLSTNQLDRAATHLRAALQLDSRRAASHRLLGIALAQQGRTAEGIAELQTAVNLQSGDLETLRQLGIVQGQSGQLEAAVRTFARAIQLYPNSSRDHYLLGRALAALGRIDAAVPYFAQAVKLDPNNAEARQDLERAQRDAPGAAGVRR